MATNLPPNVASGELITSVWGNAVADELERLRTEVWANFVHGGGTTSVYGTFDCGTTNLGPFTFPVQVGVWWWTDIGYAAHNTWGGADLVRLSDGGSSVAVGNILSIGTSGGGGGASSITMIPLMHCYNVSPGLNAGFRTRATFSQTTATPITFLYRSQGTYFVKRTDIA